ncbi:hypothetical protein N657DRAFT_320669 [Parathielavia appendiculata]|uniref:Uncharacterized protein n=1 Tax=Parathielavia appendiculata TaxID=2587402 RepID=A0AAN6Z038_9PEZI|nr:hypothetical protein N657DRAFT_320669 [Parathielavia appendiculata]
MIGRCRHRAESGKASRLRRHASDRRGLAEAVTPLLTASSLITGCAGSSCGAAQRAVSCNWCKWRRREPTGIEPYRTELRWLGVSISSDSCLLSWPSSENVMFDSWKLPSSCSRESLLDWGQSL